MQSKTGNIRGLSGTVSTPANVLSYFMDNNIAVSVGVDASTITTQDADYTSVLKRCAALGLSKCELYVQGSVAASTQGNVDSADEVKAQLQTADDQIKALIPGFVPEVYVPYQNSATENVIAAAKAVGFAAIASTDSSLAWDLNASPMQMSPQTSTGVQDSNGAWQANPTDKIVSDCTAAADRGEVCVIQVTANEFASGAYSTEKVQELVAGLNAAGFTDSITFHTVISALQANSPSTAPTQGPLASSDSNGDVLSYLTSPPPYMIAVISVVGLLLIAGISYFAFAYSRPKNTEKEQKRSKTDLDSISTDNLMDFAVEQNEDKTPPSSLRISIQYDQLSALSPASSPMAVNRSSQERPGSAAIEHLQQVELV